MQELDFNQFTQDMLFIEKMDSDVPLHVFRVFDDIIAGKETNQKYIEEFKKYSPKSPEFARLWDLYQKYIQSPTGPFAEELNRLWNNMSPLFDLDISAVPRTSISMIFREIDTFNKVTQLDILKTMTTRGYFQDTLNKTKILSAIAANEFATTSDKVVVAKAIGAKNMNIVRDTLEALKADLTKELSQQFPNQKLIPTICDAAQSLCKTVKSKMNNQELAEHEAYLDTVYREFDIDNISNFGFDYIAKTQQSLEERALNAEEQVKEQADAIRDKDTQISQLNDRLSAEIKAKDEYKAKLDTALKEKAALEKQLRDAENARTRLANQLDEVEKKLRAEKNKAVKFKDAAAALETGWGSKKGIEAFKKEIAEAYKDETYQI